MILTGDFPPEFLVTSIRSTIPVKAAYFHPKKLVKLNFRSQYETGSSENLFSENKNLLFQSNLEEQRKSLKKP